MQIEKWSAFVVPVLLLVILAAGLRNKVPVYDTFLVGVQEGMKTVVKVFPAILAIYVAAAMLRTSGLLSALGKVFAPLLSALGLPEELLPLALLRPVSGSGSIGLVSGILRRYGPDSFIGYTAAVMCSATETTFYTLAVYFGAAQVKKPSVALPAALIVDGIVVVASVIICRALFFG